MDSRSIALGLKALIFRNPGSVPAQLPERGRSITSEAPSPSMVPV